MLLTIQKSKKCSMLRVSTLTRQFEANMNKKVRWFKINGIIQQSFKSFDSHSIHSCSNQILQLSQPLSILTVLQITSLLSKFWKTNVLELLTTWHLRFIYSVTSLHLKKNDDVSSTFDPTSSYMPSIYSDTTGISEFSNDEISFIPSFNNISNIEFPTACDSSLGISGPSYIPSLSKLSSDLSSSMNYLEHVDKPYVVPPMFYDTNDSFIEDQFAISEPDFEWDYPNSGTTLRQRLCDVQKLGFECIEHN